MNTLENVLNNFSNIFNPLEQDQKKSNRVKVLFLQSNNDETFEKNLLNAKLPKATVNAALTTLFLLKEENVNIWSQKSDSLLKKRITAFNDFHKEFYLESEKVGKYGLGVSNDISSDNYSLIKDAFILNNKFQDYLASLEKLPLKIETKRVLETLNEKYRSYFITEASNPASPSLPAVSTSQPAFSDLNFNYNSPWKKPEGFTFQSKDSFPYIDDGKRFVVTSKTQAGVLQEALPANSNQDFLSVLSSPEIYQKLNQGESTKDYLEKIHYFKAREEGNQGTVLGRYDVIASPCIMNFDANWNELANNQEPFYVFHAAAINIGENGREIDFNDFSKSGKLDEQKYLTAMQEIFKNLLQAAQQTGVSELVMFPFGMGAFLRNLYRNDSSYSNYVEGGKEKAFSLRKGIANCFIKELENFPDLKVHFCLPTDNKPGSESTQNANAFVYAISNSRKDLKSQVSLYVNEDASELSQKLSNEKGAYKVGMVNGANRNLLGNFWFLPGVYSAIDENLHRRSTLLALISLFLNQSIGNKGRSSSYLADRVQELKGKVTQI